MKKTNKIILTVYFLFLNYLSFGQNNSSFKTWGDVEPLFNTSTKKASSYLTKYNYLTENEPLEENGCVIHLFYTEDKKTNNPDYFYLYTKKDNVVMLELEIFRNPKNDEKGKLALEKILTFENSLTANGFKMTNSFVKDDISYKYFENNKSKTKVKIQFDDNANILIAIYKNEIDESISVNAE